MGDKEGSFKFQTSFAHGRVAYELSIMYQFLVSNKHVISEWLTCQPKEWAETFLQDMREVLEQGFDFEQAEKIRSLVSEYNYRHRLKITDKVSLNELVDLEKRFIPNLLPPPMPCDYVDSNLWTTGDEEADQESWLGHGFFWKSGEGEMDKDLAFSDYDALEDKWCKLKQAKVLVADYELIRNDFPDLKINLWLLEHTSYISEGQIKRISPGGDLQDCIDLSEGLDHYIDFNQNNIALRMKGGGRAATFFTGPYSFSRGWFQAPMIEVKGGGTSILQPKFERKACGFLSLVDSLKEFAYQKLIQSIADKQRIDSDEKWGTVGYYAILDTGLKFKDDKQNPATGYKGDRCSLCVRQRQSRVVSSPDEVVYYSVVRHHQQATKRGSALRKALNSVHLSSEQLPMSLTGKSLLELDKELEGNWNIQADASFSHLVDFSHWFVLPSSPLPEVWKISEEAVRNAFKLGGEFLGLFDFPAITKLVFNTEDVEKAKKLLEDEKEDLIQRFGNVGEFGRKKPALSWSWFLEVDDSQVMSWAYEKGFTFQGKAEEEEVMNLIKSWLP
eukprot:TRINITY_DN1551_c0_g1_i3.p1 TRINITY_DN1551_c0_g1~~TRINITY_DN1551_c0_g1_i3.p1  ORF type:complete len:558 (+),score=100.24 TRINITY_DN1551_c0_g1_i3:29-1702(+)